jgi:hypothetical protein
MVIRGEGEETERKEETHNYYTVDSHWRALTSTYLQSKLPNLGKIDTSYRKMMRSASGV